MGRILAATYSYIVQGSRDSESDNDTVTLDVYAIHPRFRSYVNMYKRTCRITTLCLMTSSTPPVTTASWTTASSLIRGRTNADLAYEARSKLFEANPATIVSSWYLDHGKCSSY